MIYRILSMPLIVGALVVVLMIPVTAVGGGNAATESTHAMSAENSIEGTLTAMESYGHLLIRPEVGNLARLKLRPDAVITRNGKPYAVISKMDGSELEDYILAKHFRLENEFKQAVEEFESGGTIKAHDLLKKLESESPDEV